MALTDGDRIQMTALAMMRYVYMAQGYTMGWTVVNYPPLILTTIDKPA